MIHFYFLAFFRSESGQILHKTAEMCREVRCLSHLFARETTTKTTTAKRGGTITATVMSIAI